MYLKHSKDNLATRNDLIDSLKDNKLASKKEEIT
jgi:hypothetical protein